VNDLNKYNGGGEKILLMLLPFMTKLIPPMGVSCLKSFLEPRGFNIKTVDANLEEQFEDIYNAYFDTLRQYVPVHKQGNFYSIGHDVLRNHMMLHFDRVYQHPGRDTDDGNRYMEALKQVAAKTYFRALSDEQAARLDNIAATFFARFEEYFQDLMDREQPTVLGLSVFSDTLPLSLAAFKMAKARLPQLKTVMGGGIFADQLAPGSPNLEHFLEETASYIDTIIIGEGEILFLKLLNGELPAGRRVFTRADAKGEVLDLAAAPVPGFSDLDVRYYPYMSTYTSRSCPYQCSFCAETVNWGKYRKKSARQGADELLHLYREYGSQLFLIADSLLNPVISGLSSELINRGASIYFDGYLRAGSQASSVENTLLWRRGVFYRARLGIESGSPHVLELMNKNITVQQIKDSIAALAHAGIKTTTYWIMGFPGESGEDFQQTLDLVAELKENIYEAECKPFYYHLTGQVKSQDWLSQYRRIPLYTGSAAQRLMLQTWLIDCQPDREETYRRVSRFIEHCKQLGIPNPYSLKDIYNADQRWKRLQKNAVPPLVEFKDNDGLIDENRTFNPTLLVASHHEPEEDTGFNF
jgi:hypothetical protein